jgi:flavin-dependent dehydrogenase
VEKLRTQVAVVGAGMAGLLAATRLTEAGLDCVVLEKRPRRAWGSRFCIEIDSGSILNGILPAPGPDVVIHEGESGADILSPGGRHGFNVTPLPVHFVRLWRYERQLLQAALDKGVDCWFGAEVASLGRDMKERPTLEVVQGDRSRTLVSDLVVLATGNSHRFDRELYAHFHLRRRVANDDFLEAWQELWRTDPSGLAGAAPRGLSAYRVGNEGPVSTLGVWTSPDGSLGALLAGTVVADGWRPPRELLRLEREALGEGWTRRLTAGGMSIPVRRPVESLVAPGIAVIGHSGCQVYPLTGCGVSLIGRAAQELAEPARLYCQEGRRVEALWPYNERYQRGPGARQAASEVFVRWMRGSPWGSGLVERLFELGLTRAQDYLRSLELGPAVPGLLAMAGRLPGALRLEGDKARYVAGMMARSVAIGEAYGRFYPSVPDMARVRSFAARAERLLARP